MESSINNKINNSNVFPRIMGFSTAIYIIYDISSRTVLFANSKLKEYLGYNVDEVNQLGLALLHQEYRQVFLNDFERILCLSDDDHLESEYKVRSRANEILTFSIRFTILEYDSQNCPQQILAIGHNITESKKKQALALESGNLIEQLFESMLDGYALHEIICDFEGNPIDYRYILANSTFEKLTGLRNVVGKTILELVPNIEKYWIETFGRVALTGEATVYENYVKEFERWFKVSVYSPKHGQFALVFSDINESKKIEESFQEDEKRLKEQNEEYLSINEEYQAVNEELRESNEKIYEILKELSVEKQKVEESEVLLKESQKVAMLGHYVLDIASGIWTSSDMLDEIFGIDESYVKSIPGWLQIVHPEHQQMMLEYFSNDIIKEGKKFNKEYMISRVSDQQARWVRGIGSLEFGTDGSPIKMFGVIQDITIYKKTQKEKDHLLKVINSSFNEIYIFDPVTLKFEYINDGAIKNLGYSREQLMSMSPVDIKPEFTYEKFRKVVNPLLEGNEELLLFETLHQRVDGSTYNVEVRLQLVQTAEKNVFLAIINDVTARKIAEDLIKLKELELKEQNEEFLAINEELRESHERIQAINEELRFAKNKAEESDALKSAFLANISHEIRTPMNGIIGFAEMLIRDDLQREKQIQYSNIIIESSRQLLSIINDVLDISIIESGNVLVRNEEVNLNDIILELWNFYSAPANRNNLNLYTKKGLNDYQAKILVDRTKLQKILSNLIGNAIKFTHEGQIEFGYFKKDSMLEFYVKDSGIGIDKPHQLVIFERFRQVDDSLNRNYGGAGLGLAISKALVEKLGGEIWLKSAKGEGTTFFFTIPYIPVNKEEEPLLSSNSELDNQKGIVLVVEDTEINFLYMDELLTDLGYSVLHAKNGLEAFEISKSNPKIGLVLMDIKMPIMNGYESCALIKQHRPNLPIVAQTAYAMSTEKEAILDSGFDGYISKPIKKNDLLYVLKLTLRDL